MKLISDYEKMALLSALLTPEESVIFLPFL